MTLYDIMYKAITEKYENGEITFEQANELNNLAYDRYVTEGKPGAIERAADAIDRGIAKFKKFRADNAANRAVKKEKKRDAQDEKEYQRRLPRYEEQAKTLPWKYYVQIGNGPKKLYGQTDGEQAFFKADRKGLDVTMYEVDTKTGREKVVMANNKR